MQIIRREHPAIIVQILNRRLEWQLLRDHPGSARHFRSLFEVTRRARRNDIVPCRFTAAAARHNMIKGQIFAGTAILTLKTVAKEHVEARKGRVARRLHISFQANNTWKPHGKAWRGYGMVILGDDIHTVEKDSLDRVLPGP